MDLKSALECVKSQISTSNNSTYKKKKDNIFSSTNKDKKKASLSFIFNLSLLLKKSKLKPIFKQHQHYMIK